MKYLIIAVLLLSVVLAGCKPVEIPAQLVTDARLCVQDVKITEVAYQTRMETEARNKPKRMFYKSEQNALMSEAMQALKDVAMKTDNDAHAQELRMSIIGCGTEIVAFLQTTGQISANRHGTSRKALGVAGVVTGIYATGWAFDKVLSAASGPSGDTWNVKGSRVVNGSGNGATQTTVSSSGDGLGQANTFNRAGGDLQGISGYEPRTNPVQTTSIGVNQPQSASGTNEPSTPSEGANVPILEPITTDPVIP